MNTNASISKVFEYERHISLPKNYTYMTNDTGIYTNLKQCGS